MYECKGSCGKQPFRVDTDWLKLHTTAKLSNLANYFPPASPESHTLPPPSQTP